MSLGAEVALSPETAWLFKLMSEGKRGLGRHYSDRRGGTAVVRE